jgi:hypothetical protein
LEQYELALKLDPSSAALRSHKAAALAMLNRWEVAEQSVRLPYSSIRNHFLRFMLEIAMTEQGKT